MQLTFFGNSAVVSILQTQFLMLAYGRGIGGTGILWWSIMEFGSEYSHFSRAFMSLRCWEEFRPIGIVEGIEVSVPN